MTENKSKCQLIELIIELKEKLNLDNLPSENLPVTLYVEILIRLNELWDDLDDTNQKYEILQILPSIAWNISHNTIKNPQNRRKLMLHHFKINIPKEERDQQSILL